MKKIFVLLTFVALVCVDANAQQSAAQVLSSETLENALQNHLDHFYPAIIDSIHGGYYTNFSYDWELMPQQDKMIVTQARDLWVAALAAQAFPENKLYRQAAQQGYEFITSKMWDHKTGGFQLHYFLGHPNRKQDYKLLYGHAFALFALAEYAKIDSSQEVKDWLYKAFNWMEQNGHDDKFGGYFNLLISDKLKPGRSRIMRWGWGDPGWKDQNTSIHIMEAFTTLYEVMPTAKIRNRLEEMLVLVRDTMTQKNGSLKLYFTNDWQPIDHSDSTRSYILRNQGTDHVSFGHNIETAYLLIDASKALYGKVDPKTLEVAKKLTDHTLLYGFDHDYYGLFDRGYVFNGTMEIIDKRKSWWAQYEAWHTLALMQSYFPDNLVYPEACSKMWQYINTELVDSTYGGQYNYGRDTAPKNITYPKAHEWKGPYHDGRALYKVWMSEELIK